MSESFNIREIRHIPEESVLLIDYNITEQGVWDLYQIHTAFRNPDEDFWTVMYPAVTDARHSNFPITVAPNSSFYGTFVWKYADIRGIGSDNFNGTLSYNVQVTVYKEAPVLPGGGEEDPANSENPVRQPPTDPSSEPDPPRTRTPIPPPWKPRDDDPPDDPPTGGGLGRPRPDYVPPPINPGRGQGRPAPDFVPGGIRLDPDAAITNPDLPGGGGGGGGAGGGGGGAGGGRYDPPAGTLPPLDIQPPNPPNDDPTQPGRPRPGTTYQYYASLPKVPPDQGGIPNDDPFVPVPISQVRPGNSPVTTIPGEPPTQTSEDPADQTPLSRPQPLGIPGGVYNPNGEIPGRPRGPAKPVSDVAIIITDQRPQTNIKRPDTTVAGEGSRRDSLQVSLGKSAAIVSQLSLQPGTLSETKNINYTLPNSVYGYTEGQQVKFNYNTKSNVGVDYSTVITHLDTSSLISNATFLLELPKTDIPKGEKIFIGAIFALPAEVSVPTCLELWLVDSQNRTILLKKSEYTMVDSKNPIALDSLLGSTNFTPGPLTVIAVARDNLGKVIGLRSKLVNIRPTLSTLGQETNVRVRQSKNIVDTDSLPGQIVDYINIKDDPINLSTFNNSTILLILEKVPYSPNRIGLVLLGQTVGDSAGYRVSVYSEINTTGLTRESSLDSRMFGGTIPPRIEVGEELGSRRLLASSNKRLILNGKELYPESHLVGIDPLVTTASELLVQVSKYHYTEKNVKSNFKLYCSSSYRLKQSYVSSLTKISERVYTIGVGTPYVNQEIALLVHGKNAKNIDENYELSYANTDDGGFCVFSNINIDKDDYFSLLIKDYNTFNPVKNVLLTAKI